MHAVLLWYFYRETGADFEIGLGKSREKIHKKIDCKIKYTKTQFKQTQTGTFPNRILPLSSY